MTDILHLQRLPQIESLDVNPCNLVIGAEQPGCSLCTHTCCCTAK